jgi:hypothetical protein
MKIAVLISKSEVQEEGKKIAPFSSFLVNIKKLLFSTVKYKSNFADCSMGQITLF